MEPSMVGLLLRCSEEQLLHEWPRLGTQFVELKLRVPMT